MANKLSTKYKSNIQEKKVSEEIGGKTVIASGALSGMKGDARSPELLVECKTTSKSSYRLTLKVWDKIRREAIKDGLRVPVMNIELDDGKCRIAVFAEHAFDNYEDYYKYSPEETARNTQQSVLITTHEHNYKCIFVSPTPKVTLIIMPWEDFLQIIQSEEKEV